MAAPGRADQAEHVSDVYGLLIHLLSRHSLPDSVGGTNMFKLLYH